MREMRHLSVLWRISKEQKEESEIRSLNENIAGTHILMWRAKYMYAFKTWKRPVRNVNRLYSPNIVL